MKFFLLGMTGRVFTRMPRYRLSYGEVREFDAQGVGEVVPVMQERHRIGRCDDEYSFMRRAAMEMCEWSGKNFYFHSRAALGESMLLNGLLEVID